MRNRFKGLDLIDRVPDELWMEVHDIVQKTGIKTIPKKNICKKAKWLSEEAKLPTSIGSSKQTNKQEFQKNFYFYFTLKPNPLTVWITTNCGKFLKRWEYQAT